MAKKNPTQYKYYNMNIPLELRILFEAYLREFPNFGIKNVSQFILYILQKEAEKIIEENPELKKINRFEISRNLYILQENGTYKKTKIREKSPS